HLARNQMWLTQYRHVVAAIPAGARVFPVSTRVGEGTIAPYLHAPAYIAIDRGGLMPYAFNADTANPEKYLRYIKKPYAHRESWDHQRAWNAVDWNRVARDYDYVLVEKPFQRGRLPLHLTQAAGNQSATLLRIDKDTSRSLARGTVASRQR